MLMRSEVVAGMEWAWAWTGITTWAFEWETVVGDYARQTYADLENHERKAFRAAGYACMHAS